MLATETYIGCRASKRKIQSLTDACSNRAPGVIPQTGNELKMMGHEQQTAPEAAWCTATFFCRQKKIIVLLPVIFHHFEVIVQNGSILSPWRTCETDRRHRVTRNWPRFSKFAVRTI